MAKLKIEINDSQNLKDLLQEVYNLSNEQIVQVQNEINKLASATQLQNESIDGKEKYAKAVNAYLGMKDKAIAKKLDVAKILSEVIKHAGDMNKYPAEGESTPKKNDFDFSDIRKMVDELSEEKVKTIQIRKD